jgi:prepilin-type N-terminal cleavage/methylation domain-containing protein
MTGARKRRHESARRKSDSGFTLIEMLVVVVIIGVLAAVAVYAYTRHVQSSRYVDAKEMLKLIQAREELYFQRHGVFLSATEHPTMADNFNAKAWAPPNNHAFRTLKVRPQQTATRFSYRVAAFAAGATPDATSTALGIDSSAPWYYACARADVKGDGSPYMEMCVTSQPTPLRVTNEGQ